MLTVYQTVCDTVCENPSSWVSKTLPQSSRSFTASWKSIGESLREPDFCSIQTLAVPSFLPKSLVSEPVQWLLRFKSPDSKESVGRSSPGAPRHSSLGLEARGFLSVQHPLVSVLGQAGPNCDTRIPIFCQEFLPLVSRCLCSCQYFGVRTVPQALC